MMLLRRGERDRGVQAGDADYGAIQIVEGFFVDDGGDFSRQAAGAGVFVKDDHLVCLLDGLRDCPAVNRNQRAQVQDLDFNSFFGENGRGFQRGVDHGRVGDDADVGAFSGDARLPDGDYIILLRHFFFNPAVEIFVLEEDAGIVVADGGFDQTFGVVGRGWADDFEAGIVNEPHFGILRVEGAAVDVSATGTAQDEGSRRSPEIVRFGDHVADLVEVAADEIHELKFSDRAHAGERSSEGCADDGGFGDGRVDDALGAEAIDESVGDFEGAAVDADVFAEAEDGGVAVHFFPDSLADGFEVG